MFETFKSFVVNLADGNKHPSGFDDSDYRVASAALLIHAATIDDNFSAVERQRLHELLMQRYDLDDAAADELIAKASKVEQEAIDVFHFTRLLNRTFDEAGRCRMIEMMWEIAYADGKAGEFEENLIWRAADLLGVSSAERIALRQHVAASRGIKPE